MVERFISAECEACWQQAEDPPAGASAWVLDWIVPAANGEAAALAVAALPEAQARVQRLGVQLSSGAVSRQRATLRRRPGTTLKVVSGPAWHGYFGVQLDLGGAWPRGSTAWMALVEVVPLGVDGTPVPRQLVRNVAGPIGLDSATARQRHTRAMRWPESARPERLRAAAWIEASDGRIVAFARDGCAAR